MKQQRQKHRAKYVLDSGLETWITINSGKTVTVSLREKWGHAGKKTNPNNYGKVYETWKKIRNAQGNQKESGGIRGS